MSLNEVLEILYVDSMNPYFRSFLPNMKNISHVVQFFLVIKQNICFGLEAETYKKTVRKWGSQ